MKRVILPLAAALAALAATQSWAAAKASANLIKQTSYHLEQFEKEVSLQRGGEKMIYRSKREALERVKQLKIDYPDDPEVDKLVQRARVALLKSMGQFYEVDPSWTTYKRNAEHLRKIVFAEGSKAWDAELAKYKDKILAEVFPAPDPKKVSIEDLEDRYVVLKDVRYPARQFYGAAGEYVWSGKPSEGYYFVDIAGREWLGPYEAVKRFRRTVDSELEDVKSWTVLGRITDIVAEIPQAGENKVGNFQLGWVVKPVMLMVPGHVVALHDAKAPASGRYVAEDKVPGIKESWYTVKDIPANATPERVMEIFMTAIREKNFDLFVKCINPERLKGEHSNEMVRYHWDLHQQRFAHEYVHAKFDKARIEVVKGFDSDNELNQFFLADDQKAFLEKAKGMKIETAIVESRAVNEQGQQVGSPHPHKLVRFGGKRWYVEDYLARF